MDPTEDFCGAGWLSTDAEEISRRRCRGQKARLLSQNLEPEHPWFGTYQVRSEKGALYQVEIRSYVKHHNFCSCPDYSINGLGTCKHIEWVLFQLQKTLGKREFHRLSKEGSERIEIYLHRDQVAIDWPQNKNMGKSQFPDLASLFSADGLLLTDPLEGILKLTRIQSEIGTSHLRLSQQLDILLKNLQKTKKRADAEANYRSKPLGSLVNTQLYPFQEEGALHLALNERAILADEIGMGKTIQALAACEILRRTKGMQKVLIVAPESLKTDWIEQIARWTNLSATYVHGTKKSRISSYGSPTPFHVTHYEQVRQDYREIQSILKPDIIILDEAHRLRRWEMKTTWAVKQLKSPYLFILTGSWPDHCIDEIYSLVQIVDPAILGPLFRFNREFYQLDDYGKPIGHKNLTILKERLKPIVLKRSKSNLGEYLPLQTVNNYFVLMTPKQKERYNGCIEQASKLLISARKQPISPRDLEKIRQIFLQLKRLSDVACFLEVNDGGCPKIDELKEVLEDILIDRSQKVVIFSEWNHTLEQAQRLVETMNVQCAGPILQANPSEIERFHKDPNCRILFTNDNDDYTLDVPQIPVIINLDIPWDPQIATQRMARIFGFDKPLQIINLIHDVPNYQMMHA